MFTERNYRRGRNTSTFVSPATQKQISQCGLQCNRNSQTQLTGLRNRTGNTRCVKVNACTCSYVAEHNYRMSWRHKLRLSPSRNHLPWFITSLRSFFSHLQNVFSGSISARPVNTRVENTTLATRPDTRVDVTAQRGKMRHSARAARNHNVAATQACSAMATTQLQAILSFHRGGQIMTSSR